MTINPTCAETVMVLREGEAWGEVDLVPHPHGLILKINACEVGLIDLRGGEKGEYAELVVTADLEHIQRGSLGDIEHVFTIRKEE